MKRRSGNALPDWPQHKLWPEILDIDSRRVRSQKTAHPPITLARVIEEAACQHGKQRKKKITKTDTAEV
jgi:hypothetical protein